MALYAVGDIQGCFDQLKSLLERIDFDPSEDQVWFTGDLVNRGPKSLETIRYIKDLGNAAVTVLGNHDLHLLAVAKTSKKQRKKDTLVNILCAEDRDELLDWLCRRPLFHHNGNLCLVHAGLPPQWDLTQAKVHAHEVEVILRGPDIKDYLHNMYGDTPLHWSDSLLGWERFRFITNCLTRMRYCDLQGNIDLKHKGPPGTQPDGLIPWFEHPDRRTTATNIVFGHWSSLGFRDQNGIYSLDTGCLWGGHLTALRLDGEICRTSLKCPLTRKP